MESIIINNKRYTLVIGNGKDDAYRESFNTLTEKTFVLILNSGMKGAIGKISICHIHLWMVTKLFQMYRSTL